MSDDGSEAVTETGTGTSRDAAVLVWIGSASPPEGLSAGPGRFSQVIRLESPSRKPQQIVEALRASAAADRAARMSMVVGFDPGVSVVPAVAMYEALSTLSSRRPDLIRPGHDAPVQAEVLRRKIVDMRKKLVSLRGASEESPVRCLQVSSGLTSAAAPPGLPSVSLNDPQASFSRTAAEVMRARHVRLAVSESVEESVIALIVVSTLRRSRSRSSRPYLVHGDERYRPDAPATGAVDLNTVHAGVSEVRKTEASRSSVTVLPYEQPPEVLTSIQAMTESVPLEAVLRIVGSAPAGTDPTRWTCPKLPAGIIGRSCPRMPRHVDVTSVDPSDQGLTRQQNTVQCAVCDTSPVDPLRLYSESRMVSMYDAPLLLQREVASREDAG